MYFDALIKYMSAFLEQNSLKVEADGIITGNDKTFKIAYNEQTKLYELFLKLEDGSFKVISAFLFDETQTEKDVESVALDFIDTLRGELGIKKKISHTNVALPQSDDGEKVTKSGLTQKLLAIFPQFKETYKIHVSENDRFLMVNFYHETFIPAARELVRSNNKKAIKKFYDALSDMFIKGDGETVPFVVGIAAACVYDDAELLKAFKEYTADQGSFYTSVHNLSAEFRHNKKLKKVF